MNWTRQLLTGANNETLAIGRVFGAIVFVIFLIAMPIIAVATIGRSVIDAVAWSAIFDKLTVYVPAVCLAVGGLIGLTAPSEPKSGPQ